MKPATLMKVRQIDQELKTEFYKILDEKGEERPTIAATADDVPVVIHKQHETKAVENEARMLKHQKTYKEKQEAFKQEMV